MKNISSFFLRTSAAPLWLRLCSLLLAGTLLLPGTASAQEVCSNGTERTTMQTA